MPNNISVSKVNGYTKDNVLLATEYLKEIGNKMRTFPFSRLVEMYNTLYKTNESASGCKCHASKYYNGIKNFRHFGLHTLIANGIIKDESELELDEPKTDDVENSENRLNLGTVVASDSVSDQDPTTTKVDEQNAVTAKTTKKRKK